MTSGETLAPPVLAGAWRGDIRESAHRGHVAVAGANGEILAAWGDPGAKVLPRS